MTKKRPKFHNPSKIQITNNPLAEAWLTVNWELETAVDIPGAIDPEFNSAFVNFSNSVRDRFKQIAPLPTLQIPEQLAPYRPRYQFKNGEDKWPLLQLGPGVATVNFVAPYTWRDFRKTSLYMITRLLGSYKTQQLKTRLLSLRYRNAVPFKYSNENVLPYLESHLNFAIKFPDYIPGNASSAPNPVLFEFSSTFDLSYPQGKGNLVITTGNKREKNPVSGELTDVEHIVFDIEVISQQIKMPPLEDRLAITDWLDSAHAVIHDWFFSMIQGPLREEYSKEG